MPLPVPPALRALAKRPAFALAATAVVALGVALATTAASIVDALIFRPIPVDGLDQIYRAHSGVYGGATTPPDARDLFERVSPLVFAYSHRFSVEYEMHPHSGMVVLCEMQGNPFETLRWQAAQGRLLRDADMLEGSEPVALVSHAFWQNELAGKPDIVGQSVRLNNKPFRIVGVLPPERDRVHRTIRPAFWTPLVHTFDHWIYNNRNSHSQTVLARLGPDETPAAYQTQLDQVDAYLATLGTDVTGKLDFRAVQETAAAYEQNRDTVAQSKLIVGLVAALLLIACFNLGNMLLSHAYSREREFAIRRSLGASPKQIVRQLLGGSLFISALGGAVGLALSLWLVRLADNLPFTRWVDVTLDRNAVFAALATTLFTGVVSGLIPAVHLARGDSADALRRGGKSSSVTLSTKILVVAQVAISAALLTASLAYLHAMKKGLSFDPGYDADRIAYFEVSFQSVPNNSRQKAAEALRDRLAALPGVESASFSTLRPLRGWGTTDVKIVGSTDDNAKEQNIAENAFFSEGFLDTLGVPILRGRDSRPDETGWPYQVALINEAMAKRYWPDTDALGQQFYPWGGAGEDPVRVIGIFRDFPRAPWAPPSPLYFLPQANSRQNMFVRTEGDPRSLLPTLQTLVRDPANDFVAQEINFYSDAQDAAFRQEKSALIVLGALALSALLLASAGIWYTTRQYVRQSRKELSIRLAIGARPSNLLTLTLRRSLNLALVGLAIGAALSFVTVRWIQTTQQGVSTTQLQPYLLMAATLFAVALGASYLPARSALRADPKEALSEV